MTTGEQKSYKKGEKFFRLLFDHGAMQPVDGRGKGNDDS